MRAFARKGALAVFVALALTSLQTAGVRGQVSVPGIDKPVVVHRGRITASETWQSQFYHVLRGAVFVESGATLTMEPGTTSARTWE